MIHFKLFIFLTLQIFGLVSYAADEQQTQTSSAQEISSSSNSLDAVDIEVTQIFKDQADNFIVQFKYGAVSIGTNKFFWSPGHSGTFYQLQSNGHYGTSEEYELSFLAPTTTNPQRTAKIKVDKSGLLEVSCDGVSECFNRIEKSEESAMQSAFRAGTLRLEGLPSTRDIVYSFKIEGTETYIVVDAPRFNFSYDFAVFMGPKNHLQPVQVQNVSRLRDGGTTTIKLADGRIIYSPARQRNQNAKLYQSGDDLNGSHLIPLEISVTFAESLGMNAERFSVPGMRTPVSGEGLCEAFLKNDF